MGRGGKASDREEPHRRCIATGESGPAARLVRFVLGPDGSVVPDIAKRLPGRGAWLTADRKLVEKAASKRLFARAFRTPVTVPDHLPDLLETLLAERAVSMIAMARKAGQAVTGFEKTRARLESGAATGAVGLLLAAADGSADGRSKLARIAGPVPVADCLTAAELGVAFGRDFAVHAALDAGRLAAAVHGETLRLAGMRSGADPAGGGGWKTRDAADAAGAMGAPSSGGIDGSGSEGGPRREFG